MTDMTDSANIQVQLINTYPLHVLAHIQSVFFCIFYPHPKISELGHKSDNIFISMSKSICMFHSE